MHSLWMAVLAIVASVSMAKGGKSPLHISEHVRVTRQSSFVNDLYCPDDLFQDITVMGMWGPLHPNGFCNPPDQDFSGYPDPEFFENWCNRFRLQCAQLGQCQDMLECLDGRGGNSITTEECYRRLSSSSESLSSESLSESGSRPSIGECMEILGCEQVDNCVAVFDCLDGADPGVASSFDCFKNP